MTQVMLPALHQAADTAHDAPIVMIGSIGGRVAGPVLGAYCAAKHGLAGMTGSLRADLAAFGITVVLIEPGAIATPIWRSHPELGDDVAHDRPELRARSAPQLDGARAMAKNGLTKGLAPDVAARVIADALTKTDPSPRQLVGPDAKIMAALIRLLPFRAIYRITAARR